MALQFENENLCLYLQRNFKEGNYHEKYRCMVIFITHTVYGKATDMFGKLKSLAATKFAILIQSLCCR